MGKARYLLAVGLIAAATQVQGATGWLDDDITDILNKVRSTFTTVAGNIKDAADDLIDQKGKRTQAIKDNVDDVLTFLENRQTPFQDFVNGGAGRCGAGSPCAQFRTDLRTFALQMAELKDRFPLLQRDGLADTDFFPELVNVAPPFVLFGVYEILQRIPDWQDLPVDLADIFDEIGDPEAFSTTVQASAQASPGTKTALATIAGPPGLGKTLDEFEAFCSRGKEPLVDDVKFNKWKGVVTRWKNRLDSASEYPPESATISLVGMGLGNLKLPLKPFLKTVSNALDSVHDMMESYRDNLELCARIEADLAAGAPLVQYRSPAGVRKAYFVFQGILNRSSLGSLDKTNASNLRDQARRKYNEGKFREAYGLLCDAYAAL